MPLSARRLAVLLLLLGCSGFGAWPGPLQAQQCYQKAGNVMCCDANGNCQRR